MSINRKSSRRVLIVCAAVVMCGALGAGPAAAASTPSSPSTPEAKSDPAGDLLGLGALLGATNLVASDQPAVQPVTGSLAGVTNALRGLPVLGPVVGGVADDTLPLLGVGTSGKPVTAAPAPVSGAGAAAAGVVPKAAVGPLASVASVARPGSTWTAPHTAGSGDSAPVKSAPHETVISAARHIAANVASMVPSTASGRAEMGAAAVALIVLGGVAIAGAAGAAGFVSRRQIVGGPW